MKASARILTLVMAFIFAIPTNFPNQEQGMEFIPSAFAQETRSQCEERGPGWYWNTGGVSGRCSQTDAAQAAASRARACDQESTEEKRRDCYKSSALKGAEEANVADENRNMNKTGHWANPFDASTPALMATILSAWYMLRKKTNPGSAACGSISMWLMIGAGAAAMIGEITSSVFYRNKLKKIVIRYREESQTGAENAEETEGEAVGFNDENAARIDSAQVSAFNYLIDQETARRTAAKIRAYSYLGSGGLYLGAMIAAIVEGFQDGASLGLSQSANNCVSSTQGTSASMKVGWAAAGIIGGYGGNIITEGAAQEAKGKAPTPTSTRDESNNSNDDGAFFTPMNPQSIKKQIQNPEVNLSIEPKLVQNKTIVHPFSNLLNYVVNDATYEIRKASNFHFDYTESTQTEQSEMLVRFMHHFIPEAFAAENDSRLDRTGEILDKDNKVKRAVHPVVDVVLEAVKLVCRTLMFVGLTGAISLAIGNDTMLDRFLQFPTGRAIMGGVLSGYAFTIMGLSFGEVANANERIDVITSIRDQFKSAGTSFDSCVSRDDPSEPLCYCYTLEGKNENRSDSEICKMVYGQDVPTGSFWGSLANNGDGLGLKCVTSDNKLHIGGNCPCRRANKGKSSCSKLRMRGSLPDMGLMRLTGDMAKSFDADMSGELSAGDLAAGATRTKNIMKQLDKMKKDKKFSKLFNEINKGSGKLKQLHVKMASPLRNAGVGGRYTASPTSLPTSGSPSELKKAIDESLMKSKGLEFKEGGAPAGGKKEGGFDFDFGAAEGAVTQDEIAGVMGDEYKINDINNNAGASIFQILSIRYQKTGMRKLFEEEEPETK